MRQKSQAENRRGAPARGSAEQTSGETFSDGTLLELAVSAGKLSLLFWDGERARVHDRFERAGRTYVPASLNAGTLRAIRFPNVPKDYGSTGLLFSKLLDVLNRCFPLPDRDLNLVAHWVWTTWFPDVVPMAPSLVISGPSRAYVARFLRLLKCVCRRGLRLAELNPAGFCALPMKLQPTLLVEQTTLTRSMGGLFRASSSRGIYISQSGDLLDLHCAQALFSARNGFDAIVTESSLRVPVVPAESGSLILDERAEQDVAAEFQPMFFAVSLAEPASRQPVYVRRSGVHAGIARPRTKSRGCDRRRRRIVGSDRILARTPGCRRPSPPHDSSRGGHYHRRAGADPRSETETNAHQGVDAFG